MKTKRLLLYSIWTALFLLGFLLGSVMGGLLNTLLPVRIGFWNQETEYTNLRVTLLRHTILSPTQIRTTIQLSNIGPYQVDANVTLFYKNSSSANLATHSYNATINAGAVKSNIFTVNLSADDWVATDISIQEQ